MLVTIRAIHRLRRQVYGSPRLHSELRDLGWKCGRHRVARLIRHNGVRVKVKRRFRLTTQSRHGHPVAANLLERNFTALRPNEIWAADITYIWTREGWLYLAVVMDAFSRRIVGWCVKPRLTAELALKALPMALRAFRWEVGRPWWRVLRRRSQNNRLAWRRMNLYIQRWLPPARVCHPFPLERLCAMTQGGNQMR